MYCTVDEAQSLLRPPVLTTSSTPTLAEADGMGEDVYAEIHGALTSNGVTVPVAAPASFVALLKGIMKDGWAARIAAVRARDDRGINSDGAASLLERRYQANLKRLWDGTAIPKSLLDGDTAMASSYQVAHPDTEPTLGRFRPSAFGPGFKP